jgi:hypothetical protein
MTDWFAQLLLGPGWGLISQLLPCPLDAGWSIQRDVPLPGPGGGYSAIQMESGWRRFWLLSDLPEGELSTWTLPAGVSPPRRLKAVRLQVPEQVTQQLDGEGLVIDGDQVWVASEGRRSRERPAQLLRFSLASGALVQAVPLPPLWQPGAQQGLSSNAGPEGLARLSRSGQPLALLMAAEHPLRQDPVDQIRLLRWDWPAGSAARREPPRASEQGALEAPADGPWGLTDLLVLHPQQAGTPLLLTLWRRYHEPLQWSNQLRLYRLPEPGQVVKALQHWDLQADGLRSENWEGLSFGPLSFSRSLSPEQPSLLLVSDDNRNPLQTSRLALLKPHRSATCARQQP